MSHHNNRIHYLLEAFTSKKATDEEQSELMEWMRQAEEDSELKDYIQGVWNDSNSHVPANRVNWSQMFDSIMQNEKVVPVLPIKRRISWSRVAAAVVFMLLLGIGTYVYVSRENHRELAAASAEAEIKNDVTAPAGNKAVLTLSDGSKIELDAAAQGAIAHQGGVKVEKSADGQIVYKGTASESKLNTLSVPKGSKPVWLVLADGSNVWLNVASSITYPTAFSGNERSVEITGEAYFEVAHESNKPFYVKKNNLTIRVLGTHFNVNTYDDEKAMKITLLQGSVAVSGNAHNAGTSKILKPGEQALVSESGNGIRVQPADVDQVMAWKNGLFSFDESDLKAVMRQLTKWYDVDVEYQGVVPHLMFGGDIERSLSLAQTLKILEKSGVHFKIDGRKIIVLP